MKVGIIGCGAIANIIVDNVKSDSNIDIRYFIDNDLEKAKKLSNIAGAKLTSNIEEMVGDVDLVLESASPAAVREYACKILNHGKDIIIMSIGALMDKKLFEKLKYLANKNNAKIHIPSGAVVGLDGIKSVADYGISYASLLTRKSPKSLGIEIDEEKILFEGKASEAVKKFPANINVSAAISLACKKDIDVKIIADPNIDRNIHEILVKGDFGEFKSITENLPSKSNPKTSMLAAISAIELLKSLNSSIQIGT